VAANQLSVLRVLPTIRLVFSFLLFLTSFFGVIDGSEKKKKEYISNLPKSRNS
jgi:hypothetical protein